MNKEVNKIIDDIKNTIMPIMIKWRDDNFNRITEMSIKYKNEVENRKKLNVNNKSWKIWKDEYERYAFIYGLGATKEETYYVVNYNKKEVEKFVQKKIEQSLKKIDVAVNKKIKDKVTAVKLNYIKDGKDGYVEGSWDLNTNKGNKEFKFETIYAGGYNIQCLHIRTKYYYN